MLRIMIGLSLILIGSFKIFASNMKVPIGAIAALSSTDSEYSERFRYVFKETTLHAIQLENKAARKCGFELEPFFEFYKGGDALAPVDAVKKIQGIEPWLIIGPDKSS